jgi:hypothetical protein
MLAVLSAGVPKSIRDGIILLKHHIKFLALILWRFPHAGTVEAIETSKGTQQ